MILGYDANGLAQDVNIGASELLSGTQYIAFGDSLVSNQSTNASHEIYNGTDILGRVHTDEIVRGYIMDIEDRYGVTATKFGDSGGTILRNYALAVAQDYSKASLATFAFGTNDARTGVDLGTKDSSDIQTYAGCLNGILRKAYLDNPEIKIVVITPPQRLVVNAFGSWTPNDKGKTLEDFAAMAKAVAGRRSTLCADVFHDSRLNQTTLFFDTREGVHPLNGGYRRMTNVIVPLLDRMLSMPSELYGSMTIPGSPASGDSPVVNVPLPASLFVKDGYEWNGTDGVMGKGERKQVGTGIKLENGKTYLYTFYTTYEGLPERNYAINDNGAAIAGSGTWDKWNKQRGQSEPEKVEIGGKVYYKWTAAIAVPAVGDFYIWPVMINALGAESLSLRYF